MTRKRTVAFSPQAVNLFFHILTRCNLKCRHCYINPDQHGTETLPLNTIENWLKVFAELGKPANLILLGGEPTLHPDLAAVVQTARRLQFASVTIDTNGYLFHDILDRLTPADLDYFSFSLDGATAETNDALRGRGSYDACLAGIRRAVAKGFSTSLIYTVSTANIDELPQMGPLLEDLGIDRFFIQVLGIRGNPARQTDGMAADRPLQVDRDRWLAVVPAAAEQIADRGLTVTYPKVFLSPGRISPAPARWPTIFSFFPTAGFIAVPYAKISPCTA
jgi:molybdenum cofactor biosynthesis enzyme MoaA